MNAPTPIYYYPIITVLGNWAWFSRPVIFSSRLSRWTFPFSSVTRETSVCSPGVAPFHM